MNSISVPTSSVIPSLLDHGEKGSQVHGVRGCEIALDRLPLQAHPQTPLKKMLTEMEYVIQDEESKSLTQKEYFGFL